MTDDEQKKEKGSETSIRMMRKDANRLLRVTGDLMRRDGRKYNQQQTISALIDFWEAQMEKR